MGYGDWAVTYRLEGGGGEAEEGMTESYSLTLVTSPLVRIPAAASV